MKVYHITLNEPVDGETDFYFSSQTALCKTFPKEIIGITYKSLGHAMNGNDVYINKRCTIRRGSLQGNSRKSNLITIKID